ncbi:hypothetical protein BV20DRAFT_961604 [Pilatotrama ljubarskyi]|nr:hypothetical protein BV20DRAFT_961604 [Pilatotrama ljubarskyi]
MATLSADEYDALPDPFEGVDFDQVPELCGVTDDKESDYDAYFDDLDVNELDSVPHLGPIHIAPGPSSVATSSQSQAAVPAAPNGAQPVSERETGEQSAPDSQGGSHHPPTPYVFDEVDDAFLQQVDRIEAATVAGGRAAPNALLPPSSQSSSGERIHASNRLAGRVVTQRSSLKRRRSEALSTPASPSKRSKLGRVKSKDVFVDPHASARKILEKAEEELTCPICHELLVVTQSTNPCGHSCCGQCLLSWLKPHKLTCPICRTKLDRQRPVIPNLVMDNVVSNHVSALAGIGMVEWQPTSEQYKDFLRRKEQSSSLAEQLAKLQNAPPPAPVGAFTDSQLAAYVEYQEAQDEDFEDEAASAGSRSDSESDA